MGELPSLSTDLGNTSVEMHVNSGQGTCPASVFGQSTNPDGAFVNNLTFGVEGLDSQDWASLGIELPWNSSMHSMLDNPLLELPHPMTFFFRSPSEVLGQADTHSVPPPMDSEPMVHQLECETPTPSFTQSLAIPSSQTQSSQTSTETTSHPTVRDDVDLEPWRAEDYGHVPYITNEAYDIMTSTFKQLNSDNAYCIPFTNKHLPSLQHMQIYMQIYFEEYHPVFPLLHKATFSPTKDDWLLSLAVSSIGCLFSKTLQSREVYPIMQEFLRRAIRIQLERSQTLAPSICVAQASVLNQIGMMYGGDLRFAECAHETMAQLATQCRKIASFSDNLAKSTVAEHAVSRDWQEWIRAQLEIRLFYCAWLIDSQQVGFFAFSSTIPIDFLQFPMPVNEYVWGMSAPETWKHSLTEDSSCHHFVSLRKVLLGLYRYREVPGRLDAFNSLLLIMGILNDLSWLRHAHLYLDILQRHVETLPPTALTRAAMTNIHMVSLLIYFPTREVIAFGRWRVTEAQHSMVIHKLKRWMSNPRSAREALIHACSIWSQIRLSRTNAQHEAPAFLHSAISIWALVEHSEEIDAGTVDGFPILRLDNLNQEVKSWAAGNEKKRLYLSGVGLLGHQGALARLIIETARLLEEKVAWPQAWRTGPYLKQSYAESRRVRQCAN
ncbi:Zinc finger protein klf1 [Fusarium oxysporum f. sp. rapae]|uniref:Zinc finger protein klf1 n=1 Tax=Fusarium oxysporum f. sp. rapae TaxID=485398 RepID=A0A8J5NLQ5_FUSOX|nr:Zinc finger protein klf1 [Fusarium oxysporum f. sp. rapae]